MQQIDPEYSELINLATQINSQPSSLMVSFHRRAIPDGFTDDGVPQYKEKIYIEKIFDLGNSVLDRPARINPNLPASQNDALLFPKEWAAFQNGTSEVRTGIPLELLFRNSPAKVKTYEFFHIYTVEQLIGLAHSDILKLGIGAREDVAYAKEYYENLKASGPTLKLKEEVDAMKKENAFYKDEIGELKNTIAQLMKGNEKKKGKEE